MYSIQFDNFRLDEVSNLWDVYVDLEELRYKKWSDMQITYTYDPHILFHNVFVPTHSSEMIKYVAGMLLRCKKPILITGDAGEGKGALAKDVNIFGMFKYFKYSSIKYSAFLYFTTDS